MPVLRFAMFGSCVLAAASAALAATPQQSVRQSASAPAAAAGAPNPVSRAQFLASVQARFNAIDTNHDGTIDAIEIAAAQQKNVEEARGLEQQRLEAEFARLDTNHDGELTKAEFMAALAPVHSRQTPQQVIGALDTNGDGKISLGEYEAAPLLKFNRLDANHDGTVSPQEMESAPSPGKRP